jgi:hypothetical protein
VGRLPIGVEDVHVLRLDEVNHIHPRGASSIGQECDLNWGEFSRNIVHEILILFLNNSLCIWNNKKFVYPKH